MRRTGTRESERVRRTSLPAAAKRSYDAADSALLLVPRSRSPHAAAALVPDPRSSSPHSAAALAHTASALAPDQLRTRRNVRAEPRHVRARIRESDISIRPDKIESACADAGVARRLVPGELVQLDAEGGDIPPRAPSARGRTRGPATAARRAARSCPSHSSGSTVAGRRRRSRRSCPRSTRCRGTRR